MVGSATQVSFGSLIDRDTSCYTPLVNSADLFARFALSDQRAVSGSFLSSGRQWPSRPCGRFGSDCASAPDCAPAIPTCAHERLRVFCASALPAPPVTAATRTAQRPPHRGDRWHRRRSARIPPPAERAELPAPGSRRGSQTRYGTCPPRGSQPQCRALSQTNRGASALRSEAEPFVGEECRHHEGDGACPHGN
jgi:hypothetical protein